MLTLDELIWAIPQAWNTETLYPASGSRYAVKFDNPATGQCLVSTLLVRRHLGGDLMRCGVGQAGYRTVHYFNQLENGMWIDVTRSQFSSRSPVGDIKKNPDPKLWEFGDIWERVALLERRVTECLFSTYVDPEPLQQRLMASSSLP